MFSPVSGQTPKSLKTFARAQKAVSVGTPSDVYIAIDMSASLTLPNTPAEVRDLEQLTGCMFSCHQSTRADGRTDYQFARDNGITMREDVLKLAMTDFINRNFGVQNINERASIIGFANEAMQLTPLINDRQQLISSLDIPLVSEELALSFY